MQDYLNYKLELATTISVTDEQSMQSTITDIFVPTVKPEKTSQAPITTTVTPSTKPSVSFADPATPGNELVNGFRSTAPAFFRGLKDNSQDRGFTYGATEKHPVRQPGHLP